MSLSVAVALALAGVCRVPLSLSHLSACPSPPSLHPGMPNMGTLHPVPAYRRPTITRLEMCLQYKSDIVTTAAADHATSNAEPPPPQANLTLVANGIARTDQERALLIEARIKAAIALRGTTVAAREPTQSSVPVPPSRNGDDQRDGGEGHDGCQLLPAVDFYGNDLRGAPAPSMDLCCEICAGTHGCVAWSYLPGSHASAASKRESTCWLKSAAPPSSMRQRDDVVSGTLSVRGDGG